MIKIYLYSHGLCIIIYELLRLHTVASLVSPNRKSPGDYAMVAAAEIRQK